MASDILNIVSGALMLFAMAGDIFFSGTLAMVASVAGPLAILVALAGLGLMIYMMLERPPNPVKGFVDKYVKAAGLYVSGKSNSIDYATPYINPDQSNLLMVGFTLRLADQRKTVTAADNGSISLSEGTFFPNASGRRRPMDWA